MNDCIFCKIIKGEIPSKKRYEDEDFVIIDDISHRAKTHCLIIPKKHYSGFAEQTEEDGIKLAKILRKLKSLEKELGIENGYRLIVNQKADGGQTVMHLHVHVIGGEKLKLLP